jgi:hypothetical protein
MTAPTSDGGSPASTVTSSDPNYRSKTAATTNIIGGRRDVKLHTNGGSVPTDISQLSVTDPSGDIPDKGGILDWKNGPAAYLNMQYLGDYAGNTVDGKRTVVPNDTPDTEHFVNNNNPSTYSEGVDHMSYWANIGSCLFGACGFGPVDVTDSTSAVPNTHLHASISSIDLGDNPATGIDANFDLFSTADLSEFGDADAINSAFGTSLASGESAIIIATHNLIKETVFEHYAKLDNDNWDFWALDQSGNVVDLNDNLLTDAQVEQFFTSLDGIQVHIESPDTNKDLSRAVLEFTTGPEPTTISILGLGLVGLGAIRRRRKAAA